MINNIITKPQSNKSNISIIEIVVYIFIIGSLAVLIVITCINMDKKDSTVNLKNNLLYSAMTIQNYYNNYNKFPTTNYCNILPLTSSDPSFSDDTPSLCVKIDTPFTYIFDNDANPKSYCLDAKDDSGTSYYITSKDNVSSNEITDFVPAIGTCNNH